ncbi:sulfotransferase [Beijerinckia sp. L45]|uniref:sulfotransferase family protein n=1 Tax=Beijerinckia sp. L45 TaxID=1641855 RepID=UPI00131AFCA0|nr:sulfotransferase [Beijerinckia sp. L45]
MRDGIGNEWSIDAPVILLGRGGSGTRMLSEIARGLGIFLGNHVNATGDSVEWVATLYELAIENLAVDVQSVPEQEACWRQRLQRLAADVLAVDGRRASDPWGWKLPETMLGLGPILRAFPAARVVHLVRHPVASALRRTHMTSRMDNPIGQAVLPVAYRFCGLDPQRIGDDDVHLHNAATWAVQIAGVLDVIRVQEPRVLQIAYEDMCRDPRGTQVALATFLGLDVPAPSIVPDVDRARLNDGAGCDARAQQVWSICGTIAGALGYDRDGSYRRQVMLA